MDLIWTNTAHVPQGELVSPALDLQYGDEQNDFELTHSTPGLLLSDGCYIGAEDTEFGGRVDAVRITVDDGHALYTLTGRTWHGLLAGKILQPDSGADRLTVSGDANSIIRTVTAVERADVVIIVIDAKEGITEQDAKIAGIAHERGKGIIVAVNKWDAIEKNDKTIYQYTNKLKETLSFMPYAEYIFISAETGQRLPKLFELVDAVRQNQNMRVATGVLNEIVSEAVAMQQPPSDKGKRLKIYYVTQVAVKPPTFVVFVNDKELMHFSYTRYLENQIRNAFGFRGTSLKFLIRERKDKDK